MRSGRLNRLLTSATDAFIGVAEAHRTYLVRGEGFPDEKVVLIPNGVDTERFQFRQAAREQLRAEWRIEADAPCFGLVAALRSPRRTTSRCCGSPSGSARRFPRAVW
ncbi:MAG: glycosyltransferase [Pirellulaceae bacterium]